MSNETVSTKKSRDLSTPAHQPASEPVPSQPAPASAPTEPEVSIEMLMKLIPDEAKAQLAMLKDQVASAPGPIQKALAGYIFGSDPPAPVTPPQAVASSPDFSTLPVDHDKTVELTQQIADKNKNVTKVNVTSHLRRKFPDAEVPYGFKDIPSIHIYSSEVNNYEPLQFVALDLLQFGSRPAVIAKSKRKVKTLAANGTIVEIPAKTPFGIIAEGDMVAIIKPIVEDPTGAIEYFVAPTCIENIEGIDIVRFRVLVGERFERAKLWP